MHIKSIRTCCVFIGLLVMGCKKDIKPVLPGDAGDTGVNFYLASDVLLSYGDASGVNDFFYIDTPVDTGKQTTVGTVFNATQPEFPAYQWDYHNSIDYLRLKASAHHIIFTDGLRQPVEDTIINLPANGNNSLYLADVPNVTTPAYQLFAVPEVPQSTPGKVSVRFIDLSPDADSLNCYRDLADGSRQFDVLPAGKLGYSSITAYIPLDTAGAVNNKINLHFFTGQDTAHDLLLTRLDVNNGAGHAYVVVIQGFVSAAFKQVPDGTGPDGSPQYQNVSVAPNVRINTRQSN